MSRRDIVVYTCNRCGTQASDGRDYWSYVTIDLDSNQSMDLCEKCASEFKALVKSFLRKRPAGVRLGSAEPKEPRG